VKAASKIKAGNPGRPRKFRVANHDPEQLHRYWDGRSIRAMAEDWGISKSSAHRILKECGINSELRGGRPRKKT